MAKSLRSKWRRKCRAVKRERYAVKELDRLKKTLGIDDNEVKQVKEVEMNEISEIATVVDAKKIKENIEAKQAMCEDVEMADITRSRTKIKPDKNGSYPIWMSKRKIKQNSKDKLKMKHKKGRAKSQRSTKISNKRLTRRQKKIIEEK